MFEIPTTSASLSYRQTTDLSGRTYVLDFEWSERSESWYLDVSLREEGEDTPVLQGVRLSLEWLLLSSDASENRPPGELVLLGEPPTKTNLGTGARLYYYEPGELV